MKVSLALVIEEWEERTVRKAMTGSEDKNNVLVLAKRGQTNGHWEPGRPKATRVNTDNKEGTKPEYMDHEDLPPMPTRTQPDQFEPPQSNTVRLQQRASRTEDIQSRQKPTRTPMTVKPRISKLANRTMDQISDTIAQTMVPISVGELSTHCLDIRKKLRKDLSVRSGTGIREPKQVKPIRKRSLSTEEIRMRQSVPHVRGYVEDHEVQSVFLDADSELNLMLRTFMKEDLRQKVDTRNSFVTTSANDTKDRSEGILCSVSVSIHGVESLVSFLVVPNASYDVLLGDSYLSQVNRLLSWEGKRQYLHITDARAQEVVKFVVACRMSEDTSESEYNESNIDSEPRVLLIRVTVQRSQSNQQCYVGD